MRRIEDIDWTRLTAEETDRLLSERLSAYEHSIEARGGKRPRREGHVMERLASMETLREADRQAQKGKRSRRVHIRGKMVTIPNRHIHRHNEHAEDDLRRLQRMILTLNFPPVVYRHEPIKTDAGKVRDLAKQDFFPWRILQTAVKIVTDGRIVAGLIDDTCACIKGRGIHYGAMRLKSRLRRHPELKWFWKTDFKKYYQSIPHHVIMEAYARLYKDRTFLRLLELAILCYESSEEVERELNDEEQRNKRNPHWGCDKPEHRQSRGIAHRPPHEGKRTADGVYPLLRRCAGSCPDEGGGYPTDAEFPQTCHGGWSRGEGECGGVAHRSKCKQP